MPSRNTIEVIINATDNASRVFNSLGDNSQKIGKLITAGIVGGFTAATVAITGFAVRGVQEFMVFEKSMSETFKLLPGLSSTAMKEMENDVKRVATIYGQLPAEVAEGFASAIGAGIDTSIITNFMNTAAKAAIAGTTDIQTAVDGLTSVVNAYGSDVIDATRASDIMFKTVDLGKVSFDELSRYLFNVIPTASSLGLKFEDVGAAIAQLTAQGTPASVATTQIRQLLVELQKPTTKVSELFQEMAGKSFPDFIKQGGNLSEALELIQRGANQSGEELAGIFGSVEALNAFLGLSGKNAQKYAGFIEEMGDSAGSTQRAFEVMQKNLSFQLDRMNTKISVLFINIGEKLAPLATQAFKDLGDIVSAFILILQGVDSTRIEDFLNEINPAIRPLVKTFFAIGDEIRRVTSIIVRFINGIRAGVPFLDNLKGLMAAIFPPEVAMVINKIISGFNDLWLAIKPIVDTIINFVKENVKLQDVLIAIGIAVSSFVIPAIIAIGAAIAPIIGTFALMVGAVTLLRKAWETDFLGIQTFVTEKLIPALQMLADWFINDALPKAIDFVQNVAIPALQLFVNWLSGIWESVKPALESVANWFINDALPAVLNFITGTVIPGIGNFIQLLINIWNFVRPNLEKLYNWFVTEGLPALVRFVETTVIPGVQSFIDLLLGIWDTVRPILESLLNWFITEGLPLAINFINETVIPGVQGFIDLLLGIWDIVSPILSNLLDWFITTGLPLLVNFVKDTVIPGVQGFIDLLKGIWTTVQTPLNNLKNGISRIFEWIKTNVIDPIIGRIQEFIQTLQNLGIIQGDVQSTVNNAVQNATTNPSSAVTNPSDLFGYANGLPFVPRDNFPAMLHKGERVLTAQENRDLSNSQNQSTKPTITIENLILGDIKNQSDANEKARMFVNGLRAQGMEI